MCHCPLLKRPQSCILSLYTKTSAQGKKKEYCIKIYKKSLFQSALQVEAELLIPAGHCQNICHLCLRGQLGHMTSCGVGVTHRALLLAHGKLGTWDRRQKDGRNWGNWRWMNVPINPSHSDALLPLTSITSLPFPLYLFFFSLQRYSHMWIYMAFYEFIFWYNSILWAFGGNEDKSNPTSGNIQNILKYIHWYAYVCL